MKDTTKDAWLFIDATKTPEVHKAYLSIQDIKAIRQELKRALKDPWLSKGKRYARLRHLAHVFDLRRGKK